MIPRAAVADERVAHDNRARSFWLSRSGMLIDLADLWTLARAVRRSPR